jgi:4-methyl-5(b-hydroxyethyl)-thiazole monophosphate biosynthesis
MASNARKVLIPIADGTEPMEAVITIDVIRRSGADVTVASAANNLSVKALHGVKIISDASVSDIANTAFDLIALPVRISLSLISIIDMLYVLLIA